LPKRFLRKREKRKVEICSACSGFPRLRLKALYGVSLLGNRKGIESASMESFLEDSEKVEMRIPNLPGKRLMGNPRDIVFGYCAG